MNLATKIRAILTPLALIQHSYLTFHCFSKLSKDNTREVVKHLPQAVDTGRNKKS